AGDVALPVRGGAEAGRLPAQRAFLPLLLETLPALAAAAAAEGGRARARHSRARAPPAGCAPSPVARRPGARPAPASAARPGRVHGARPPAAPDRTEARALADPARTIRPGCRPQRARSRDAGGPRGRRDSDPAPGLPERPDPCGRRPHAALSRHDPALQGAR